LIKKIKKKVVKDLINITRDEATYLREKGFGRFIAISSSTHKSRAKTYWLTENPNVLRLIMEYRSSAVLEHHE
jgi:hypothetical protein